MEMGLRQGDPLAHFLFLVVVECLHIMVEEAKVGKDKVDIPHLQYADDVVLFGECDTSNIKNIIKLLDCFHVVSGLKMNVRM